MDSVRIAHQRYLTGKHTTRGQPKQLGNRIASSTASALRRSHIIYPPKPSRRTTPSTSPAAPTGTTTTPPSPSSSSATSSSPSSSAAATATSVSPIRFRGLRVPWLSLVVDAESRVLGRGVGVELYGGNVR